MIDNIIKQSFSDYIKVTENDTVNRLPESLEDFPNLINIWTIWYRKIYEFSQYNKKIQQK